jgi:acetoacetyl-CoA synthetase
MNEVLWAPSPERRRSSVLKRYTEFLEADGLGPFTSYEELWGWSVTDLEAFWASIWRFFDVGSPVPVEVLSSRRMPGCRWFPGAELNYAEQALRGRGGLGDNRAQAAVVSLSQTRGPVELSFAELAEAVARARAGLQSLGVKKGDRVVAYLPNIAETIVAFLATAGIGAIWASCPPEFGRRSVLERFSQLEPKVLIAVDGYRYGDKTIDRGEDLAAIRSGLSTLQATVTVPYLGARPAPGTIGWDSLIARGADPVAVPVAFDHPLYVLFSSGTTSRPKAIVHSHGGITLEHLKALGLQSDLKAGDRFFWYSTTGWMMWNFLVSGLLVGASVVCFDGDPAHPGLGALWSMAEGQQVSYFGTSAPYLTACRRAGLRPGAEFDLSRIRSVGSTGAPLPADAYRWVYGEVGSDLQLASVSGGTEVCTPFVGASAFHEVRAGQIPCRYLGAAVEAYGPDGRLLVGEVGELVVTAPMPSMPLGFWGDRDGERYRAAYFDRFPGVWHHGDWITIFADGSCEITGRSDATLNRAGVRIGTGELYAVVESIAGIEESLVLHLEDPEGGPGRIVLFVALAPGVELDDALIEMVRAELSTQLSPRHVPDLVLAVPRVPRTLSGKKLEVPVKRILLGEPADKVASAESLLDPRSLAPFLAMARAGLMKDIAHGHEEASP